MYKARLTIINKGLKPERQSKDIEVNLDFIPLLEKSNNVKDLYVSEQDNIVKVYYYYKNELIKYKIWLN